MTRLTVIILLLLVTSCVPYDDDDYQIERDDLLILEALDSAVLADGRSQARIFAILPTSPGNLLDSVTFFTTEGEFIENKKQAYTTIARVSGIFNNDTIVRDFTKLQKVAAIVMLQSSTKPGTVFVRASHRYASSTVRIQFIKAQPDSLHLDLNKFALKASFQDEIKISGKLLRMPGNVSSGIPVQIVVMDSLNKQLSQKNLFRSDSLMSNPNARFSTTFSIGETNYRGTAVVKAFVLNDKDTIATGSKSFQIISPD